MGWGHLHSYHGILYIADIFPCGPHRCCLSLDPFLWNGFQLFLIEMGFPFTFYQFWLAVLARSQWCNIIFFRKLREILLSLTSKIVISKVTFNNIYTAGSKFKPFYNTASSAYGFFELLSFGRPFTVVSVIVMPFLVKICGLPCYHGTSFSKGRSFSSSPSGSLAFLR